MAACGHANIDQNVRHRSPYVLELSSERNHTVARSPPWPEPRTSWGAHEAPRKAALSLAPSYRADTGSRLPTRGVGRAAVESTRRGRLRTTNERTGEHAPIRREYAANGRAAACEPRFGRTRFVRSGHLAGRSARR